MRILVTGGAGFIGSNLVRHLQAQPEVSDIRIIDDLSTGYSANLDGLEADFVESSILDETALHRAVVDRDAIVHLAAIPSVPRSIANPQASHDANASGTLAVLEAARRASVKHVIVASSSSVYGNNPELPKDEFAWTRPMSPYAVSKLATEAYALAYQHAYSMRTLAFRFFNVYGPGQAAGHAYAAVIPRFLTAALKGESLTIYGDGTQSRDFTYVGTVARVIHRALVTRVSPDFPVNLAYGTNTSLLQLVDTISDLLNKELAIEFADPRAGDVVASQANPARLQSVIPSIAPVSLAEGLEATINWLRSLNGEG